MYKVQLIRNSVIFILIWNGFPALATVYHSDGSAASVQGLQNAALNGDTITLPSGTFTWTSRVTITKAITLQGAGVGSTIIKDAVQSGQLLEVTLAAGNLTRITGIEFKDGGRSQVMIGILTVTGSNTNGSSFRWDNCKWYGMNGVPLINTVLGVIDHNTFDLGSVGPAIEIRGDNWNGQQWGDGSWTAATGYGSANWLFIEDNVFTNHGGFFHGYTDAYGGARFVVRHNTIFDGEISSHGTESTGRPRGCRAIEVYNNTFTGTNQQRFVSGLRSGGALFHHNNISGHQGDLADFSMVNFRSFHAFTPWDAQGCSPCSTQHGADGTSQWDANDPTIYFSGTASANSGDRAVTVSGSPGWTTNQWRGYTVKRTSNLCSSGSIPFSWIEGNTANSISYYGGAIYGGEQNLSFCIGDTLEIRKVNHALDQVGTAGGSLLNPSFTPTPPPGWNNQVVEPCYSWNNVNDRGHPVNINALGDGTPDLQPGARPNEHYFNDTPMPGYTPYIYPHPLVTDEPTPSPTPSPTASPTPAPSPTPTSTPSPTSPPSPTPTATATATPTPEPSSTPTATATATPTATTTPRHTPKPHPSHAPG